MDQYFSEGETVILQSKKFPEFNREHVIEHHSYGQWANAFTHAYVLIGLNPSPQPFLNKTWWNQTLLRKKHTPGDSLEDIINKSNLITA